MAPPTSSVSKTDTLERRESFSLRGYECWWRDQYEMLLRHGYELRPRFRPGWAPSWAGTKKHHFFFEDGHPSRHPKTMDAKRLSDGTRVMIKRLGKGSNELKIAKLFSSEKLSKDARNHCVPVLDVFSGEDSHIEFMVMPLLMTFMRPPFVSVDEVLDFMKQTLEGLIFIHENGVAHRDCSILNIMMDGEPLYPRGFHPSMSLLDAAGKRARPRRRRDVPRVKYYFTDFGISTHFDGTEETRLVTGEDGQDQDVPELHQNVPYDPFTVDVFILGNLFRKEFTADIENLSFLDPLVDKMMQVDPNDRPTSEGALALFNEIVRQQSSRSLRRTLIFYDSSRFERFLYNAESIGHEALFIIKSFLSYPRRKTR